VYVPAQAVYLRYPLHEADHPFIGTTSSGLACGCRRDDAVLRAAYEVVERDAFLRTWHGRLPTRRFHSRSIPDQDLQVDLATWSARGIELDIHALTTDVPVQVFLAIARGRLPGGTIGTAIGLGADYTGVAAARQAAYEAMQMWPELMRMLTDPRIAEHAALLVEHPEAVCEPHDHALRYMASRPCADAAMDFLLRRPLMPWNTGDREPPTDPLSELIAGLMGLGCDPVMCDLTTADVRPLGLHVVRVILPGFVPLHFGFGAEHRANPRLSGGGAHGAPVVVPPHPLC
jgi:ribosomal protein S12 methylthiotransferase accessory factor